MQNKFYQISALGSADKKNMDFLSLFNSVSTPADPNAGQLQNTIGTFGTKDVNTIQQGINTIAQDWENSPNHPLIQGFQNLYSDPKFAKRFDTPEMQLKLFDADNLVKGQAGIFRSQQEGLIPFGVDINGESLYAYNEITNDQNPDLGKNRLFTTGALMQQLGAFQNEGEADRFAKVTSVAGDPSFMGAVTGLAAKGDKKGAVNLIMKEFGHPELDALADHDDVEGASKTAFAAYNFVNNIEKLSPAQQSLSLATMGMMSYKFDDGTTLKDRAVIKGPDGSTELSFGEAISLAGAGVDVMSLQKNYDQLDVIQRVTFGKGTPSQMAATGKRMQLLGDPSMGGAAVKQSSADLGALGFKAIPSAGIGAIVGDAAVLPDQYEVVGSGGKPGQVIAVPKGLSFSTATINGSNEIRSINNVDGVRQASLGAFKTYQNQFPNTSTPSYRGTSFAAGLGQSGLLTDPYIVSALTAASVMGNTVSRQPQQQAQAQPTGPGDVILGGIKTVGALATLGKVTGLIGSGAAASGGTGAGGLAASLQGLNAAQGAASGASAASGAAAAEAGGSAAASTGMSGYFIPGAAIVAGTYGAYKTADAMGDMAAGGDRTRTGALGGAASGAAIGAGIGSVVPGIGTAIGAGVGAVVGATAGLAGDFFGSNKNRFQVARDKVRGFLADSGLVDRNTWSVTLSDGTLGDMGKDGGGGKHQFRFSDKVVGGEPEKLKAYDVDYTNDLDFTSNLMTSSLVRMMAGGKGTSIDQVAGQLGNAALGKVGFGQDMTEETFNYVRNNVRGFYAKQGIQTKEDAYALSNQMLAEGRITETDAVAIQGGINLVFDDNAFDTAQTLMAGRWHGINVAADIPQSPGPNFDVMPVQKPVGSDVKMPSIDEIESVMQQQAVDATEYEFKMNPGTYGGVPNSDMFVKSIVKYKDPWSTRQANGY